MSRSPQRRNRRNSRNTTKGQRSQKDQTGQKGQKSHDGKPRALPVSRHAQRDVVALLSGGLDSTVLLWWLAEQGYRRIDALTITYGQHNAVAETSAAEAVVARFLEQFGVERLTHTRLDLPQLAAILTGNALTDPTRVAVPEGDLTSETARALFVPNRNAILCSLAFGFAQSVGAQAVATAIYGYCTPDAAAPFARAFAEMERLALRGMTHDRQPIALLAPFVTQGWDKPDIVRAGLRLGAPLALSYSCMGAGPLACGGCPTCTERRLAFARVGEADQALYHSLPARGHNQPHQRHQRTGAA